MANKKLVNVKLLPKQAKFIFNVKKEVMYSGGYGSGKTRALCFKCILAAMEPGNVVLLVRKTLTSLKKSTLKTLLEPDGKLPPVLPRGVYHHDKQNNIISLNGGGTILYMGCDNELSIRSMNLGSVFIDEGVELDEKEYMELLYRLRNSAASIRQICCATNPGNQTHFLYERFFTQNHKDREVITSSSLDNQFLVGDYIDSLKQMTGTQYNKYVQGFWCALEKAIYPEFSREINIKCKNIKDFSEYAVGIDFGYTNPTAFTFFGVDGNYHLHLIEEFCKTKMLMHDIVKKCERYRDFNPKIIVDPSAAHVIAELESRDFNVVGADNEVNTGISRTRDMIASARLTADSKCLEWIKEIENYSFDEKGRPIKTSDHLMDSMRYVVQYIYEEKMHSNKNTVLAYSDYDGDDF